MDDAIIIECWKYMNEETSSEVKYIKEDDVSAWLEQSPRDNRRPCAGLRLIHRFQPNIWKVRSRSKPLLLLNINLVCQMSFWMLIFCFRRLWNIYSKRL